MQAEVFLDSAYAVALASRTDQHYASALALSEEIEKGKVRLLTTQAVLLEIGNALAKTKHRAAGVQLLTSLHDDPLIEIVWLTPLLHEQAFELFRNRSDKEWGLIDRLSFVVMRQRGIREALTSDAHFEQAGFRRLLVS